MKGDELDASHREETLIDLHQRLAVLGLGHLLSAKPDGLLGSGVCFACAGRSVEDEVFGRNWLRISRALVLGASRARGFHRIDDAKIKFLKLLYGFVNATFEF